MAKKIDEKKSIYFSSGSTLLDLVVGAGEKAGYGMGYPSGTIVRDWGGSSSTKSFKATELIAANYHKYKDKFKWRYCDPEHGNTIDTESLYGFSLFQPPKKGDKEVVTAQDWDYDLNRFLDSIDVANGECGIYVLDSLDSLSSVEIEDRKEDRREAYAKGKAFDDGTYGAQQAKFLSQEFFRGLTAKLEQKNALLYIISQERDNLTAGIYGKKNRLGGGRAIGFYESVRIYSKLKNKDEQKGRAVSVIIETTAEKVRHPRPFRNCFVTIHFTYGMDSLADEVDFLFDLRSDKTGELLPSRIKDIEWDGQVMDREALIAYIPEHKQRKLLKEKVIEKWDAIEDSIKVVRPSKYSVEEDE